MWREVFGIFMGILCIVVDIDIQSEMLTILQVLVDLVFLIIDICMFEEASQI
jgi:hypothetical protein